MAKPGRGKSSTSTAAARKKAASWTYEKYRIALQGDGELDGLRSVANGFDSADGFNLSRFDEWTPGQRRKVRGHYQSLYHLYAQPRRILRPRNKKHLQDLQAVFHGGENRKAFKVVFLVDHAPDDPVKVKYVAGGVALERSSRTHYELPFDKVALATDPESEINRLIDMMPGARYFYIQAGEFSFLTGNTAGLILKNILSLMSRYDGEKVIPRSSGNAGDPAKWHKWDLWLDSLHGYKFPNRMTIDKQSIEIHEGMQKQLIKRQLQNTRIKVPNGWLSVFNDEYNNFLGMGSTPQNAMVKALAEVKKMKRGSKRK